MPNLPFANYRQPLLTIFGGIAQAGTGGTLIFSAFKESAIKLGPLYRHMGVWTDEEADRFSLLTEAAPLRPFMWAKRKDQNLADRFKNLLGAGKKSDIPDFAYDPESHFGFTREFIDTFRDPHLPNNIAALPLPHESLEAATYRIIHLAAVGAYQDSRRFFDSWNVHVTDLRNLSSRDQRFDKAVDELVASLNYFGYITSSIDKAEIRDLLTDGSKSEDVINYLLEKSTSQYAKDLKSLALRIKLTPPNRALSDPFEGLLQAISSQSRKLTVAVPLKPAIAIPPVKNPANGRTSMFTSAGVVTPLEGLRDAGDRASYLPAFAPGTAVSLPRLVRTPGAALAPYISDTGALKLKGQAPGKTKYQLIRHLGSGANGDVYEATVTASGNKVAIKVLQCPTADQEMKARLTQEVRAANKGQDQAVIENLVRLKIEEAEISFRTRLANELKTQHGIRSPRVTAIYDIDETETGEAVVVMELLKGGDLEKRIERFVGYDANGDLIPTQDRIIFDKDQWMEVSLQIVEGIMDVHDFQKPEDKMFGVVHRDIKPGNIFIDVKEGAKVGDLGIAVAFENAGQETISSGGNFCGTLGYMPRRVMLGGDIDQSTDTFATCVTLYEHWTGLSPWNLTAGTPNELMVALLTKMQKPQLPKELYEAAAKNQNHYSKDYILPPSVVRPDLDIPEGLDDLIMKGLSDDAQNGFKSGKDLLLALTTLEAAGLEKLAVEAFNSTIGKKELRVTLLSEAISAYETALEKFGHRIGEKIKEKMIPLLGYLYWEADRVGNQKERHRTIEKILRYAPNSEIAKNVTQPIRYYIYTAGKGIFIPPNLTIHKFYLNENGQKEYVGAETISNDEMDPYQTPYTITLPRDIQVPIDPNDPKSKKGTKLREMCYQLELSSPIGEADFESTCQDLPARQGIDHRLTFPMVDADEEPSVVIVGGPAIARYSEANTHPSMVIPEFALRPVRHTLRYFQPTTIHHWRERIIAGINVRETTDTQKLEWLKEIMPDNWDLKKIIYDTTRSATELVEAVMIQLAESAAITDPKNNIMFLDTPVTAIKPIEAFRFADSFKDSRRPPTLDEIRLAHRGKDASAVAAGSTFLAGDAAVQSSGDFSALIPKPLSARTTDISPYSARSTGSHRTLPYGYTNGKTILSWPKVNGTSDIEGIVARLRYFLAMRISFSGLNEIPYEIKTQIESYLGTSFTHIQALHTPDASEDSLYLFDPHLEEKAIPVYGVAFDKPLHSITDHLEAVKPNEAGSYKIILVREMPEIQAYSPADHESLTWTPYP